MRRPEDALAGVSSPEAAKELEAILKTAPDLQGIAFVAPAPVKSGALEGLPAHGQPMRDAALMLRLDFLGHLHLQCMRLPWAIRKPAIGSQVTQACPFRYRLSATL